VKIIGFDGYWLCDGPPSGRNVVLSLITAWAKYFPEDKIQVFVPLGKKMLVEIPNTESVNFIVVKHRLRFHALWVLFELTPRRLQCEMVLTQNFTPILPHFRIKKTKKITFIHDVIFKRKPSWFTLKERIYLHLIGFSSRHSAGIVTSSKCEKQHIEKALKLHGTTVSAIGLDVPISLVKHPYVEPKSIIFGEFTRPFILSVGRLNIRKNIELLISAFIESKLESTYDLIIVGNADGKSDLKKTQRQSIRFLSGVEDNELSWLYTHASIFVFPSLDEGFGLPLIEASYFSCLVVASDIPVFRELNLADFYFDPTSVKDLSSKLLHSADVLHDTTLKPSQHHGTWQKQVTALREMV
jgi:glycosyltransferase involved in cell wall biosynthesis